MLYKRAISLVSDGQGSSHGYRRISRLFFLFPLYPWNEEYNSGIICDRAFRHEISKRQ